MDDGQFGRLLAEIAESRHHTDDIAERLCEEIRQSAAETRREFHAFAERRRSALEQLAASLARLGDKVDRVGEELKAEFAETRALLRRTCSDVNPRVTELERHVFPG